MRTFECKECGIVLDRDLNASINIKNEGIRLYKESIGKRQPEFKLAEHLTMDEFEIN